jgi:circadian clock protein KaiC
MFSKVPIRTLPSGVRGLDEVLGGGIPEFSLNLIVGAVGTGKTTLGHQIMFANATPERKALFFTIVGEPPIKMLRYMQQLSFFDPAKIADSIRYVDLGEEAREGGLAKVLERIVSEVEKTNPAIVVVDSLRAVLKQARVVAEGELEVQEFMQRLALHLTSCETTSFLLAEYTGDAHDSSVFTVADGIIWLYQAVDRNSVVRKLHVQKMRGQAQIPGLQTVRLTDDGMRVFPRILKPEEGAGFTNPLDERLTSGIPALDGMMGGGIPRGYSVLVAGPSGSGKTVMSNEFILEGARRGEPGVIAVFEKRPNDYASTTPHGSALEDLIKKKKLEIVYVRPLDLSIDETLTAIREAVLRVGAKRAVIDSLSGLELALAPTFKEDFRESLYRMIGALTGIGVTVMSTVELPDSFTSLQFSPHGIAFLCDAIIMQRYVEIDAELKRVMSVVKVRGSAHSKELREFEINDEGGLVVGEALRSYRGLLSGAPRKRVSAAKPGGSDGPKPRRRKA